MRPVLAVQVKNISNAMEVLIKAAILAEKVTGPALLIGFSGECLRKPLSESLSASGLAGFAGMAMIKVNKIQWIRYK
jgi:hypothetical protein